MSENKELLDKGENIAPVRSTKQSRFGVMSFSAAMLVILILVVMNIVDIIIAMEVGKPVISREASNFIVLFGILLMLAGTVLGVMGLRQRTHKKGLAIAGLVICGVFVLLILTSVLSRFF